MLWRLLALLLLPQAAFAALCDVRQFEGTAYTVCTVEAADDLRLFHAGPQGVLGSFAEVNRALAGEGAELGFAMNGGMYHRDLAPVGLFIADGVEVAPLVTQDGPGNFGLLPNGVFCIAEAAPRYAVIESISFAKAPPDCRFATQSGPMLVTRGALHPRFLPHSTSRHIRNGVGVMPGGQTAIFAISGGAVTFHSFARFFRDALGTPDALYLDGSISKAYAPGLDRHDRGFPMGPIIGTVVPKG